MIRAIIIDDELHCIHRLERLLATYCGQSVALLGTFQRLDDGIKGIVSLQPDLVFLDVRIHKETGFDLLERLPEMQFDVIFTTAFEQYAIQAFKFSAVDYLLKPVNPDDLMQAVARAAEKISKQQTAKRLEVLLHNLKDVRGQSKKIGVPTLNGLMFVAVNDIIRCQASINYTTLFLQDKQKITVAKTLKEFEKLLSEYHFFRVHNSHLINLSCVRSYHKGKGGTVLMSDLSEIEVSTRRKEELLKRLADV